ncbi:alpha-L-rhamnosidase [Microbacterium halimionae]|uniref:alpha-L-rhamnosidase n=1 Tax=Microbacterium halimionae TaxID=1526413 RepID=A0A7W3PKR8_9MICO|nr:alpha-L-rhamnosidase [Microbacterium halimionae]MBA8815157.1 alpha-L-rhamnosidase [Microbacterium halimionae]NII94052.1 alpha-L-rhamnosidase [Microbacterium halimionae]
MMVTVSAPRIEHHRDPLGIGESRPRLSWTITDAPTGWVQESYAIELTDGEGRTERIEVTSGDQVLAPWPTVALESRQRVAVQIRVKGTDGEWSDASVPTAVETGLLMPSDWQAKPVGAPWPEDADSDDRRPPLVRREFVAGDGLVRARLYASAHGLYEAEINGARVGLDALSPGWSVYRKRLRYYTYDVTDLIQSGTNAIGAWLGDGWYRGRLGWRGGFRNLFGSDLSFIGQLELIYADGRRETIATDDTWVAHESPIVRTGIYDGEDYDARAEHLGWSRAGFDDAGWQPVAVSERDPATLVAPTAPPVRCTQEVQPIAVLISPTGAHILDFGQNVVGRVRIRVTGPAGAKVRIRTSEVLQDGDIYTRPLREARSTDNYILAGRAEGEEWEPRFTFHGFRYVEIDGWPGDLAASVANGDLVARVYHTDLERTGWFDSSDARVNQLHENIVWGMRGNFVDLPTDCPQRDERVGWTGDIQVFGPTASFLYDVSGMLGGWLRDVATEQLPDGTIPWYVPVIPAHEMWTPIKPGAAWGDVATFLPWTLYERFGDRGIVAAQFDSAKRWVDLVESLAGPDRLWNEGFQLGDWLDPAAPPQDPADARTDRYLVATAYFARSARLLSHMAAVLDRTEDAERYAALADEVSAAFVRAYVSPDGRMTSDAQTAYALALKFELLSDPAQRAAAGSRLSDLVHEAGNRIATGFVGTPLLPDALTMSGHRDTAYDLLLEEECPSWLYQINMGATTIWERWDAMLPDGTVHPGTMTSFNHYALGAVGDWLHREVAGLSAVEPGYRTIRFAPRPGGGFTYAAATHTTPYGETSIEWELEFNQLRVRVSVPVGTHAVLDLVGQEPETVGHGEHERVVAIEGA